MTDAWKLNGSIFKKEAGGVSQSAHATVQPAYSSKELDFRLLRECRKDYEIGKSMPVVEVEMDLLRMMLSGPCKVCFACQ